MAAVLAGGAAPGGAGFSDVPSQVPEQASSSRARRTAPDGGHSHERELAVLAYLPHRIKHGDIAAELDITLNTLRTHLASIYRKLGVTDRDDAATRATETGLL